MKRAHRNYSLEFKKKAVELSYARGSVKQIMLYKNSCRLEHSNGNGKDFLPILRSELKKIKKLQRTWLLTL